MSVDIVFKIAGIGILVSVLNQLLKNSGRDEMATMVNIAGLVIVLLMIIDLISGLFESIKQVFGLF